VQQALQPNQKTFFFQKESKEIFCLLAGEARPPYSLFFPFAGEGRSYTPSFFLTRTMTRTANAMAA